MFPNKLSTITFHFKKKKKNGDISIILKIFCTLNNWHKSYNLTGKSYEYLSIRCNENNF